MSALEEQLRRHFAPSFREALGQDLEWRTLAQAEELARERLRGMDRASWGRELEKTLDQVFAGLARLRR